MNRRPGQTFSDAERMQKRHASGARLILIWGLILTLLLIIYLTASALITHFQYRSWTKSVHQAIRDGDAIALTALLQACQREVPELAQRPQFAVWQSRLLELQEKNARQHAVFERKLTLFRQRLNDPATDHAALLLELADVAMYASDDKDLELLRNLQLHCEMLIRQRELAVSSDGIKALHNLQAQLDELKKLQERNQWEAFYRQTELCKSEISRISAGYQKLPEITAEVEKLRTQLQDIISTAAVQERKFQASERAFAAVPEGKYVTEIIRRGKEFLALYPASCHAAKVKLLVNDLTELEQNNAENLLKQQTVMSQDAARALETFKESLQQLSAKYLTGTLFELALQTQDGQWHFFNTEEKIRFSEKADRLYEISFHDINGSPISGVFAPDGSGSVSIGNKTLHGQSKVLPTDGILPEANYQQQLITMCAQLANLQASQLPELVVALKKSCRTAAWPEHFKQDFQQMLNAVEKSLSVSAEEFIFRLKVLDFFNRNRLIFAGTVYRTGSKNYFYAAENLPPDLPLYCYNQTDKPLVMQDKLSLEALTGYEFFAPENFTILVYPDNKDDLASCWQEFSCEGSTNNWQLPDLPDSFRRQ